MVGKWEGTMHSRKVFDLGEIHVSKLLLFLDSISRKWEGVYGQLVAPAGLIKSGVVAKGTEVLFGTTLLPPTFGEIRNCGDLEGLLIDDKPPQSLEFLGAAQRGNNPLSLAIGIAIKYVVLGYRGKLRFYSKTMGSLDTFRERCSIMMGEWRYPENGPAVEKKIAPAAVVLEWQENHGGNIHRLEPILKACEKLGLQEIQPQ